MLTLSCSMFWGVFITKGDVGVGTIVGSAVFNVLVIIGLCGIFSGQVNVRWSHLQLNGGLTKYFLNSNGINVEINNLLHIKVIFVLLVYKNNSFCSELMITFHHDYICFFSLQPISLSWWPLFRDAVFYILSIIVLILVRHATVWYSTLILWSFDH